MTTQRLVPLALVLVASACYPVHEDSSYDQGTLCIFDPQSELHAAFLEDRLPEDYAWVDYIDMLMNMDPAEREQQTYDAGEPLLVVWSSFAMNDQCLQERTFGVTVERQESELQINTWVEQTRQQQSDFCITSATAELASATIEPLEQGTYQIIYGNRSYELELPFEGGAICLRSTGSAEEVDDGGR
jgi:hypothetical protein